MNKFNSGAFPVASTLACSIATCVLALLVAACIGASPAHAKTHHQAGKIASYTIVYKLSGGTNPPDQTTTIKAGKSLKTSKLKTPERKGYTFVGWYKDSSRTQKAKSIKGVSDKTKRTVYAKWQIDTFSIMYELNGGSFDDQNENPSDEQSGGLSDDQSGNLPDDQNGNSIDNQNGSSAESQNGSSFDGQREGSTGGQAGNSSDNQYGNAGEQGETPSDDQNGEPSDEQGENSNGQRIDNYTIRKSFSLPTPTRPGYTFMGWYLDEGFTQPIDAIEKGSIGDIMLYARWYECTLVAHRGYSGDSPDNSPDAIRLTRDKGFEYAELDVRFTSDGVPVMYHDAEIKAYVLGKDNSNFAVKIPISSLTYKQLQAIKFKSGQSGEGDDNVFTFYDCLTLCREIGLAPIIHLKDNTNNQIDFLMNIVADFGMADDVRWFSGTKTAIGHVVENKPDAKVLYGSFEITESRVKYAKKLASSGVDVVLGIKRTLYSDEQVALCKAARIPLCFTVLPDETTMSDYDPYISMYLVDALTVPFATDVVFP